MIGSAPPLAGRAAAAEGAKPAAVGTVEGAPLPAGGAAPSGPGQMNFLFVMVGVMVLMILMSTWSGRKEKKKRAALLASIGRHDRVQTIGGVIGTVVEMRDDEVVLRVDDSTNTRITFSRSSLQGVLKKKSESGAEASEAAAARA